MNTISLVKLFFYVGWTRCGIFLLSCAARYLYFVQLTVTNADVTHHCCSAVARTTEEEGTVTKIEWLYI